MKHIIHICIILLFAACLSGQALMAKELSHPDEELNDAEGGSYSDAYLPWWPDVHTNAKGEQVVTVNMRNELVGFLDVGGKDELNNSGATIGAGVDLGAQRKYAYFKELDHVNSATKTLSANELQSLKNKFAPYIGLKAAKASAYLRAHPLHLNPQELDLLNRNTLNTYLMAVKKAYDKITGRPGSFLKLPRNQQTILFSMVYSGRAKSNDFTYIATQYAKGNFSANPGGRESKLHK